MLVVVALAFYASLRWTVFLGMLGVSLFCLWGNQAIESATETPLWLISAVAFVIAWAGQFIGHKIEGLKPSFFEDIQFLLVGPAWLLHFMYKKVGIPY